MGQESEHHNWVFCSEAYEFKMKMSFGMHSHLEARLEINLFPAYLDCWQNLYFCGSRTTGSSCLLDMNWKFLSASRDHSHPTGHCSYDKEFKTTPYALEIYMLVKDYVLKALTTVSTHRNSPFEEWQCVGPHHKHNTEQWKYSSKRRNWPWRPFRK